MQETWVSHCADIWSNDECNNVDILVHLKYNYLIKNSTKAWETFFWVDKNSTKVSQKIVNYCCGTLLTPELRRQVSVVEHTIYLSLRVHLELTCIYSSLRTNFQVPGVSKPPKMNKTHPPMIHINKQHGTAMLKILVGLTPRP